MKLKTTLVVGGIATGVLFFLKSGFWKIAAVGTVAVAGFVWWKGRG